MKGLKADTDTDTDTEYSKEVDLSLIARNSKQPVPWNEYCVEYWLTHDNKVPHFDALKMYSCGKHHEKRGNCL